MPLKIKNRPPLTAAAFTVREHHVCAIFHISKDEARARRAHFLTQHVHWDYFNKRVLLTEIGSAIIGASLDQPLPPENANGSSAADCVAPRAAVALLLEKNPPRVCFEGVLTAWAMPSRNHKLLICFIPGTDPNNPLNLVNCYVRTNLNFLRGMILPGPGRRVRQLSDTMFELSGEPPRYRGRW